MALTAEPEPMVLPTDVLHKHPGTRQEETASGELQEMEGRRGCSLPARKHNPGWFYSSSLSFLSLNPKRGKGTLAGSSRKNLCWLNSDK